MWSENNSDENGWETILIALGFENVTSMIKAFCLYYIPEKLGLI